MGEDGGREYEISAVSRNWKLVGFRPFAASGIVEAIKDVRVLKSKVRHRREVLLAPPDAKSDHIESDITNASEALTQGNRISSYSRADIDYCHAVRKVSPRRHEFDQVIAHGNETTTAELDERWRLTVAIQYWSVGNQKLDHVGKDGVFEPAGDPRF